jgi:hypothetical protein
MAQKAECVMHLNETMIFDLVKIVVSFIFGTILTNYVARKYTERKKLIERREKLIEEYIEIYSKYIRVYNEKDKLFGDEYEIVHPIWNTVIIKIRMAFSSIKPIVQLVNEIDYCLSGIKGSLINCDDEDFKAVSRQRMKKVYYKNQKLFRIFSNPGIWSSAKKVKEIKKQN